eukprot:tig00000430_g627.t1
MCDPDHVAVKEGELSLDQLARHVSSNHAGAIATFSGTTRDHFEGKKVVRLEYEAYVPMAEKELRSICKQVREKWEVMAVAIEHRIGVVPVGEASVIIAVSSVHRREALEAVHWAIDELKARVPIWKKEMYAEAEGEGDEDSSVETSAWKENAEYYETRGMKPPEAPAASAAAPHKSHKHHHHHKRHSHGSSSDRDSTSAHDCMCKRSRPADMPITPTNGGAGACAGVNGVSPRSDSA